MFQNYFGGGLPRVDMNKYCNDTLKLIHPEVMKIVHKNFLKLIDK